MTTDPVVTPPFLSGRSYDFLKKVALVFLPAGATLYFTLAQVWNLPHPAEVVATITAIDTFLGIVLGISTRDYNRKMEVENKTEAIDGDLVVMDDDGEKYFAIRGELDPKKFADKSVVRLKVMPE
jgi:hypothetical protein